MSNKNDNYPYEIKDVTAQEKAEILKCFGDTIQEGFIRVGPKGYCFTKGFAKLAASIYNMPLRPDDTWLLTFPKSGTTWAQELIWMVANNFDYATAEAIPLICRFPFLEISMLINNEKSEKMMKEQCKGNKELEEKMAQLGTPGVELLADTPSPRFIKSHLPLSLLPPSLLDTTKVVYVARDPRDVVVSYYHHCELFQFMGMTGDFKDFWNCFIKDLLDWTPLFDNVKEAWEQRNHPNLLFLFYEDLLKDLPSAVRQVADFLGKTVTEEQVARVCEHLSFDNFKRNKSVNYDFVRDMGLCHATKSFIRKGKAGGWRDYFDEEMTRQADQWIADNLRDTDLRYPSMHEQSQ